MVLGVKSGGSGDLGGHGSEVGFERVGNCEVQDRAAARADQVVVMIGEVLGQFKASKLVGSDDSMHHTAGLEHGQVPVRRALGERSCLQDLGRGEGTTGLAQHLDQAAPPGGVALPIVTEQDANGSVQIVAHDPNPTGAWRGLSRSEMACVGPSRFLPGQTVGRHIGSRSSLASRETMAGWAVRLRSDRQCADGWRTFRPASTMRCLEPARFVTLS